MCNVFNIFRLIGNDPLPPDPPSLLPQRGIRAAISVPGHAPGTQVEYQITAK